MKRSSGVAALLVISTLAWADPGVSPEETNRTVQIVSGYLRAIQNEQTHPQALAMDVDIDAQLPRLKKHGRLHALRFITRLGKIIYDHPRFEGDNTVKKEVIARYLQAETQARSDYAASIALTPANYKFKFKGTADYAGRPAWVLQVNPRQKRVGLYKGELWVDKETYLPLREWGELVKNPSVFLKRVYFVRDYAICNGIAVPRRLISNVDTRLVGKAELTIWFDNFKIGDRLSTAAVAGGGAQMASSDGVLH